jgi:hypothetical protein
MIHGTTRLRDRQSPGKGLNTGEERQHATGDPCALLPGNIPFHGDPVPDISEGVTEKRQGVVIAIEVTAGAVIQLIAERLGVPASSVRILSGATSSQKRVLVAGMNRQQVLDRLGAVQ